MIVEERDLEDFAAAMETARRSDITTEERIAATKNAIEILYKYDALTVEHEFRKHTLDALEVLRTLAEKIPTTDEEREVSEEARKSLEEWERRLFPPGSGA
jgi:hypothetical protein